MTRTIRFWVLVLFSVAVFTCGCVKQQQQTITKKQLTLNLKENQKAQYESSSKMIKDVEFDQPSLKKDKKDQTSTIITVKFDQTVAEVGTDGTALADVTIKAVQCKMVNKNEVRYEFDSASEKSKTDPFNSIIGLSYRIAITPVGTVKVVDAAKARAVTINGEGQKLAQKILSDESIIERHQLPLPEKDSSKTIVKGDFEEKETDVKQDNAVVFDVIIKSLSCQRIDNNGILYSFDSKDSKAKTDPLFELIGKNYRIAKSSNGEIKVVDAINVDMTKLSKEAKRAVDDIFCDFVIIDRHKNLGVADISTEIPFWTQVTPSPPGLLAPKMFNKAYTVGQTGKDNTAVVTMSAKENMTQKPAEDQKASENNLGFLSKLFDSSDDYTGKLVINPSSGAVNSYEETLVSAYTAQDKPKDAAPDVAPDTLIMRLTYSLSLRKVN